MTGQYVQPPASNENLVTAMVSVITCLSNKKAAKPQFNLAYLHVSHNLNINPPYPG